MYENSESKFDWQAIHKAAILFSLSLIISISLTWGSYAYFDYIEDWRQQREQHLVRVARKFEDVQNSMEIVQKDYLKDYAALVRKQFYSETVSFEEQLLQLGDYTKQLVDKSKLDLQLFSADWHINEKSNDYTLDWLSHTPNCQILETSINVSLASLHEGHILKMLDRFYSHLPNGLLNLKFCEIKQLSPIEVNNVSKPYFKADCTFSWYVTRRQ